MKTRIHLYVSRRNVLTWLMALCMVCSAVARIAIPGWKGTENKLYVWSQIVLPVTAALLYALIVLLDGKEHFYKTAVPVFMASLYFSMAVTQNYDFGRMVTGLFWISALFFAVVYTDFTCGRRRYVWFLLPILLCPAAIILYLHRIVFQSENAVNVVLNTATHASVIPDLLMLLGICLILFAIRIHPTNEYHPTWGDRVDGRRIRSIPPISQIVPYIMVNRNGATNTFSESFEITQINRFVCQKRQEGLTNFGIVHVFLAAYCRACAKYPALNRFVSGQKIYSRGNDIQFCMVIKKEMSTDSPDTVIKLHLSPYDTAEDVYRKMNAAVDQVKNTPLDSSFDNLTTLMMMIPGLFLKFAVWLIKTLDYFGLIPAGLMELSPFHGSIFFTSMGSLGIPPVYHHLYDFGNLPVFASFGCKRRAVEVKEDGSISSRRYIDFKFTIDERIVDGFYYATFFKHFKRVIAHPEILDTPPEEVRLDVD